MKPIHDSFLNTRVFAFTLIWMVISITAATAADVQLFVGESRYDADDESEIHLIDSRGKAHRRIIAKYPVENASIDPDGTTIAYMREDREELRLIGVDGRRDRLLTRTARRDRNALSWSPNGRNIAYGHKTAFVVTSAVSVFDIKRKRTTTYNLPSSHTLGATTHAVVDLDWSPNNRYLSVLEKVIIFTGVSVRTELHTSVIDTRTGNIGYFGQHGNFGFLDNSQYLTRLSSGDIGVIDILTGSVSSLINLGPISNIRDITRGPAGRRLLVVIANAKDSFDQGLTGLTRLRGRSRNDVLGYDFMQVDIQSREAFFTTPLMESFVEDLVENRQLEWRARSSPRTFRTHTCWGWVITKQGTNGNDRIIGSPGADVIYGRNGNDYIDGRGGNDVICGGPGHDRLYGNSGNDVILGDMLINRVNDTSPGFAGKDRIFGGAGGDTLYGNAGNDIIRAGPGNDSVVGGIGNDTLDGQDGSDSVQGGEGTDHCTGFEAGSGCE